MVARLLITLGITLVVVGLLWPWLWPWLSKLGLGRLPGDIVVERENGRFYFPLMTSLIASLVLSFFAAIVFWLFRR